MPSVINTTHKYLPIERNAAIDINVELRFYGAHWNSSVRRETHRSKMV